MSVKKFFALWAALLVASALCADKPRKVTMPQYEGNTVCNLDIVGLTLSDTAATVDFVYDTSGGAGAINDGCMLIDAAGRQYALRRAEGITLGEMIAGDEKDGRTKFSLTFDPIPASVTEISFSESPGMEGAFSIYGIRLDKRRAAATEFPEAFAQAAPAAGQELPAAVTFYGEATLRGRLLGYRADMPVPISFAGYSALAPVPVQAVSVGADGTFELKVKVAGTTAGLLKFGRNVAYRVFLQPGETTEICMNLPEICRRASLFADKRPSRGDALRARGPLASLTEALAASGTLAVLASLPDMTDCSDYASFRSVIDFWAAERQKQIGALKTGAGVKNYLALEAGVDHVDRLIEVPMQMYIRNVNSGVWDRKEAWRKFQALKAEMPEDYLPVDACAAVNRPEAGLTSGYARIVSQYSDAERGHIVRCGGFDGTQLERAAAAAALARSLDEMKPLDASADSVLDALPAAYAEVLRARNAELLARIEEARAATANSILSAPDSLTGDSLFAYILASHRGRAVMIDFWATWCGPCKAGNKKLQPVKEELKNEPLDYIYLTNESSPEELWKVMAADLHGEHYRLNDVQWKSLSKKFGFGGIPTYVFVDADGRVVDQQTGFGTVEPVRLRLLKALGR